MIPHFTKAHLWRTLLDQIELETNSMKLIKTTSQTVYIMLNGCTNESSFKIEIRQLPKLTIITDIPLQPYEMKVSDGIFYTEPQGKGTKIAPGTIISKTQTIYLFNQWSERFARQRIRLPLIS
jgi:hypothetical protein